MKTKTAEKWVSKIQVVGSTGNIYTVAKDASGKYACSCPAWIYQRGGRVDCKHIKALTQLMAA